MFENSHLSMYPTLSWVIADDVGSIDDIVIDWKEPHLFYPVEVNL